jgi:hypothetical protein
MSDIVTEQSGNILRIQLNRPAQKGRHDLEHVLDVGGITRRLGRL